MLAVITWLLQVYLVILLGRVVLSWFPLSPDGAMAAIARVFYALTEPVLAPLRAILPPVQMGGMGLDLSPMIVFFVIIVLLQFL
ncbi:MAG TPA: YggT family protein [Acidimicrobiales bacterium]|nr:YggT family protein [Acidimicrobiales bacterium]